MFSCKTSQLSWTEPTSPYPSQTWPQRQSMCSWFRFGASPFADTVFFVFQWLWHRCPLTAAWVWQKNLSGKVSSQTTTIRSRDKAALLMPQCKFWWGAVDYVCKGSGYRDMLLSQAHFDLSDLCSCRFLSRGGRTMCAPVNEKWVESLKRHVDQLKKSCKKQNYTVRSLCSASQQDKLFRCFQTRWWPYLREIHLIWRNTAAF